MDAERKQQLDDALCDLFFGCSISFLTVQSIFFKQFVRLLNPNYTLPDRKMLAGPLLDRKFELLANTIREVIVQAATLLLDGWKNSVANTKNVVAIAKTLKGKSVFVDAWDFSTIKETGTALSDFVEHCSALALERYNLNVFSVGTDNASNMISMGDQVNFWHYTCNSHSGNLLFKSLTNKKFNEKVTKVVKEFKSSWLEALLIARGANKMKSSGDTRWCSIRDKFQRCFENLAPMRAIVIDNQDLPEQQKYKFKDEVVQILFDPSFGEKLDKAIQIYDPVCALVNNCQKNNCSIAYATEYWLALKFPVLNQRFENVLKDRLTKVMNKYGLAANYLCHLYKGQKFIHNDQYKNIMDQFFEMNLTDQGKQELKAYTEQSGMFQVLFARGDSSWKVFWRNASHYYPELSGLALKLLSMPASTASLERLFSQWALVHTKLRNKLKSERSSKLAAVYFSLRQIQNNNMPDIIPIIPYNLDPQEIMEDDPEEVEGELEVENYDEEVEEDEEIFWFV